MEISAMSATTAPSETKLITGEELLAMGDIGPCELIDGRIVKMSPTGGKHSFIEYRLGRKLGEFVEARKLGWVFVGEVGIYIRRNPDRIRAADVAVVSKQHLPSYPEDNFLQVTPELAVEIISPNDTWAMMRRKLEDYFSIGVGRVWVVEPENRAIVVYRSLTESQVLNEADVLKGEGPLEGFILPVASLFEE
jgi:Uma2 family endonuclease